MYARLSTFQVRDGKMDRVLHALRNQAVPAFQSMAGCSGISVLTDEDANQVVFLSEWDNRDQAVSVTTAKYRIAALERIQPDLCGPPATIVYEVTVRA